MTSESVDNVLANLDPAHPVIKYLEDGSFGYDQTTDQEARSMLAVDGVTFKEGSLGTLTGLHIETELPWLPAQNFIFAFICIMLGLTICMDTFRLPFALLHAAHHLNVFFPRLVQCRAFFTSAGLLDVCPAFFSATRPRFNSDPTSQISRM